LTNQEIQFIKFFLKNHSVLNQNCFNSNNGLRCDVCKRIILKSERDLKGVII